MSEPKSVMTVKENFQDKENTVLEDVLEDITNLESDVSDVMLDTVLSVPEETTVTDAEAVTTTKEDIVPEVVEEDTEEEEKFANMSMPQHGTI